jgi:hypothetical protein
MDFVIHSKPFPKVINSKADHTKRGLGLACVVTPNVRGTVAAPQPQHASNILQLLPSGSPPGFPYF